MNPVDPIQLTRQLVDIPSVSDDELRVGEFLLDFLKQHTPHVERMDVAPNRFNVFAQWGETPIVTFSTHMDTVPPFIPSSEEENYIYGRGSCDAKGILASMIAAILKLTEQGQTNLGLLVVVGEERGSAGAIAAGKTNRGSKYLINGEPTENQLALGTKGALRLEITSKGKMAHSAYPELGESAIDKLLDCLAKIREITLPYDPVLGQSTLNIGTITGGRAPNVISDEAKAELLIRLVDNGDTTKQAVEQACEQLADVDEVLRIPAAHLGKVVGFPTTSVAYTTDIPAFQGNWGEPFLLGPGTIHVAHTPNERVPKSQLLEAVRLYSDLAARLLRGER
jgi:acetylornithine deacetylase